MKHWIAAAALICFCSMPARAASRREALVCPVVRCDAAAPPYYHTLWGDHYQPQFSAGVLFNVSGQPVSPFTNMALIYHPASAGPVLPFAPAEIQPYIPEVGYTLLSVGAGGGAGTYRAGPGASVNFLGWVQLKAAAALSSSSNGAVSGFGHLITPSANGSGLNGGIQYSGTILRNGTVLPFNQQNWVPGEYVGLVYKYG